ncbi:lipocalin family protein [Polaromonas sp. SM01]|uniref:lipocalin family protein n=1 Tax=Polaromonas sp. SM01 TaxID=3085630 RepID=UPI002980FE1D|nr:lipocalin family protein [Polaromonas sp. SM01]MDW5443051.1 lipocalin family protein [Polaromonas sp. SM01]
MIELRKNRMRQTTAPTVATPLKHRPRPARLPLSRAAAFAAVALSFALPVLQARAENASQAPLPVVAHLDLQRYSGTWYEIARLPNSFQKKCVKGDVSAEYRPLPSGEVSVLNRCRTADGSLSQADGIARKVPPRAGEAEDVGRLQVRFAPAWLSWLPMVWGDYWVMDIAGDYSTSLVGTPDRQYLWLLSRQPDMPAAEVQRWLDKAAAHGFDTKAVTRTAVTTQP